MLLDPWRSLAQISPMYVMIEEKAIRDAATVNSQISKVALVDRTLYPGDTVFGVLYFKLPDPQDADRVRGIILQGRQMGTGNILQFTLVRREHPQ